MKHLLQLENVTAGYGGKMILNNVSLNIDEGEIVTLLGPNGAGKSTTLKAIFGQVQVSSGAVLLDGKDITANRPAQNVHEGIGYVIQGGRVFTDLSITENLLMGGYILRDRELLYQRMEQVFEFFPELELRRNLRAKTLSGGERQMLALGISLILQPRLWLLDEPSIGLAPKLVTKMLAQVKEISQALKTTVIIVEQKARQAIAFADRIYVMKVGTVVDEARPTKYQSREALRSVYLPAGREETPAM